MHEEQERAAFEAWIKTNDGHPFAGQYATLMWKAWKARASLAKPQPVGVTAFDEAVAAELPLVSEAPYNSREICQWFSERVRARLATLSAPAAQPDPGITEAECLAAELAWEANFGLDEPAQAAAVPEAVEPSEYLRGYMEGKREAAPPAGISPAPLAGSEWISIDERLPEHEAEVLVTGFEGNDPSKPRWTQIAHFHKEGSFYDHDTGEAFYPPTHWMPLPAAPRAALSQGDVSGEGEGS